MSLADQLSQEKPKPGPRCLTCDWYGLQSEDDQATFDSWITSGGTIAQLHRACSRQGLKCSVSSMAYHVRNHVAG